MPVTIDEVKEWLLANKEKPEVTELLGAFASEPKLTTEMLDKYLGEDEGKTWLQPRLDRYATKAIQTHDEKKKQEIEDEVSRKIAAEMLRRNPQETQEQKELREIRDKLNSQEQRAKRMELEAELYEFSGKNGVNRDMAKIILPAFKSSEEGQLGLQEIKRIFTEELQRELNARLVGGYKPGSGIGGDKRKPDPSKMSLKEAMAFEEAKELNDMMPGT